MKQAIANKHAGLVRLAIVTILFTGFSFAQDPSVPGPGAGLSQIVGTITSSPAYIDASVLYGSGTDVCGAINKALEDLATNYQYTSTYPNTLQEAVVDARGITGTSLTCANSPWTTTAGTWPPPASILLPAGTITISATWTLPGTTSVIGQGSALTTLKAKSGMTGNMIVMGATSSVCGNNDCHSVVVQHLKLDGSSTTANGIVNNWGEELSYVDDVAMINMGGTGLSLGASYSGTTALNTSANSGPYTKISYQGSGMCLSILGSYSGTRGVHGLSCKGAGSGTAIDIDGANNTLEDIQITGYSDGIYVGSRGPAVGNVLTNISGSVSGGSGKGLVHISNSSTYSTSGTSGVPSICPTYVTPTKNYNVCDLTVLGVGATSGNTIQDDLTATTITDSSVAMYALGEQVQSGGNLAGYSRYTTSDDGVTWYTGISPTSNCVQGSLYSCIGTATQCSSHTLFLCAPANTWVPIK